MLMSARFIGRFIGVAATMSVPNCRTVFAPLAQSVERIHGKDGLRQVHASHPRRGGDNVKERVGGTGGSACASYSASLRASDRNLVLSALRACSARSTTVKCSTLLYLNSGPVLRGPRTA